MPLTKCPNKCSKTSSGFKSELSKIKFKKVSIQLENGIEIGAYRLKGNNGSYYYYLKDIDGITQKIYMRASDEFTIRVKEQSKKENEEYDRIINNIVELNINTFYLSDDRKIHNSLTSTVRGNNISEIEEIYTEQDLVRRAGLLSLNRKYGNIQNKNTVTATFERFSSWIKNTTIDGSRIGEKNSQGIFSELINNYITLTETNKSPRTTKEILDDLSKIEKKIPSYVEFGLVDKFETETLKKSILKAKSQEQLNYISSIITPFLESINAKLSALESLEQTLSLFISIVNEYFLNKKLVYNLNDGFRIQQHDSELIDYEMLSSGEKQLLLLLINTIISSDEATVFIIDEPEISLNVKWQRKLIKTLLIFSDNKNIQFIIATHSLELLSSNRSNVSKLTNIDA